MQQKIPVNLLPGHLTPSLFIRPKKIILNLQILTLHGNKIENTVTFGYI